MVSAQSSSNDPGACSLQYEGEEGDDESMRSFEVYLARPFCLVFIFGYNIPRRGWSFWNRLWDSFLTRCGDFGQRREDFFTLHGRNWTNGIGSRSGRGHRKGALAKSVVMMLFGLGSLIDLKLVPRPHNFLSFEHSRCLCRSSSLQQ